MKTNWIWNRAASSHSAAFCKNAAAPFLALLLVIPFSHTARAQDTWQVTSGTWNVPANWSTGEVPTISSNAYIDNSGTAILSVGVSGTATTVYVGFGAVGTLNISGGSVNDQLGFMGYYAGSSGTVTLSSGTWSNSEGLLSVGLFGTGVLNISGGLLNDAAPPGNTPNTDYIGQLSTGSGTATVSGGTWNVDFLYVAASGTGTLNISGGSVNDQLGFIGGEPGGIGTAMVSSGTWSNSEGLIVGAQGTGTLTITNSGVVNIGSGAGTLILAWQGGSAGTLNLGSGGTAGTLEAAVVEGDQDAASAVVNFNQSGTYSFAPQLTGALTVNNIGTGLTILTGYNTYNGPTNITAGTLQFAQVNSMFSNGTITTGSGATLAVNAGGAGEFTNATSGYGTIGGLLSGNGGQAGSVVVFNAGSALGIDTTNAGGSLTYAGNIANAGLGLTKLGTGALVLTGSSTYTGPTNVNAGQLYVDGSIASDVTVLNGATLGGSGIIGGNVTNGGNVTPGDAPGKLTVTGNYSQSSTGMLTIRVGGTAPGEFDLLAVGGAASLSGTLQLVRLNNFILQSGEKITFLTAAGGVSGTFTDVNTGTILDATVVYSADAVSLEMLAVGASAFADLPGLTGNEAAIARNLDVVDKGKGNAALIAFLENEPLGNLPHDFDLLSPEQLTSIFNISFSFADVQAGNIENHLAEVRAQNTPSTNLGVSVRSNDSSVGLRKDDDDKKTISTPAPEETRWNLWMEGSGEFVHVDGDPNAAGYNFTTGGVTVGADYHVCDHFTVGIMGGYADTGATLTQGGAVDVNSGRLGVYSTIYGSGFYLNTLAAGGYNSYDTHRTGLGGIAQGDTDGEEFDGLISTGYDFHSSNFTVGPIASAQYTYVDINSFNENGSLAPLNIPSQSQESFRSKVGFKASSVWNMHGIVVTPMVSAAWQHEYLDTAYALDSSFASGAGNVFTVNGPQLGRDSVVVNAGVNVQWTTRFGTYLYYNGELGRKNYELNSVSGGMVLGF